MILFILRHSLPEASFAIELHFIDVDLQFNLFLHKFMCGHYECVATVAKEVVRVLPSSFNFCMQEFWSSLMTTSFSPILVECPIP